MNDKNFIEELKQKREEYGVSQTRFAVACGISRTYLNLIENGKAVPSDELREIIKKQIERFNPQEPLFLLIDYLRVRFPTTDALAVIRDVLQLKAGYMLYEDFGKYGYESQYVLGDINIMCSMQEHLGVLLELKGRGCRQIEGYLVAQERSWYDFMLDCLTAGSVIKRLDLAVNDKAGILDIPKLKEKYMAGECISYFRRNKNYTSTDKCGGGDIPQNTGETLYLGSTSSELYMCAYQKDYEQYAKNGTDIEDTEIKNRFEIRMKNERAYYAVVDLLTYRDAERTAFSIINHYVCFVDREDDKPKSQWKINDDWAWFVGENREPIRLTTKPEPFTLQKALHWLQRQVAPTIKMVQELDRQNHTTILQDMIEQAELKDKHKHLLQLEKSTIEERIDTAILQKNEGIF
ncbi:TPA: replication initiation factor domain-containing protein [Clostridioides difficile]